jgi:hypothetical protein
MFMIHTPQTIQLFGLKSDNPDEETVSGGTITFQHETDDVSKCQMIVAIEDRVYTFTFGTRGPMLETTYEDDKTREAAKQAREEAHAAALKRQHDEQEAAKVSHEHDLATSDDTTAKDVSWDAPHSQTEPTPDSPFQTRNPTESGNFAAPTSPGPNPFERPVGQARNPMMPPETQHG